MKFDTDCLFVFFIQVIPSYTSASELWEDRSNFWPLPIPEINMKTCAVLVYIAFVTCDVKQVFICLRALYISFSVNSLFLSFACLFIEQLAHFLQIYRACSHFSVMRLANASQNFMFVLWLYLLCFSNINFNHLSGGIYSFPFTFGLCVILKKNF